MTVIPELRSDLVALGYKYLGDGRCKSCGRTVQWWQRPEPSKAIIPMILVDDGEEILRKPHFGCKRAA